MLDVDTNLLDVDTSLIVVGIALLDVETFVLDVDKCELCLASVVILDDGVVGSDMDNVVFVTTLVVFNIGNPERLRENFTTSGLNCISLSLIILLVTIGLPRNSGR